MLSKKAIKMLRWFNAHRDWFYERQIVTGFTGFEDSAFNALKEHNYLDAFVDEFGAPEPEFDAEGMIHFSKQYRISDAGRAFLENRRAEQLDKWVTRSIAIAALIISVIAILLR